MPHVGIPAAKIWFVARAGTMVVLYYAARLSSAWRASGPVAARRSVDRARLAAAPLDTQIATEWTDGRSRLDALLALIEALAASLEQEVTELNRLDTSDPLYERTARRMVNPALRRFTFDQRLRDECRMLVPLLEFCGRDLAESQRINTSEQLAALAEIKAAIQSVDRG
jgi:multidrug efflux pump subunit AcrA (membrane-fusion protein)